MAFRSGKIESLLALAAVVVGAWLRLHWASHIPYNDAPDEYCHYPMAAFLAREWRPPTMADVPHRIPVCYPSLPPLGYLPAALPLLAFPPDHPEIHWFARLGNVAVGTLAIVFAYRAARRMVHGIPFFAAVVAWLFALHPQLVFLSAYVNNDASLVLATTLLWYLWIRVAQEPLTTPLLVALGVTSGLALLCKSNAMGLVLAGAGVLIGKAWTPRRAGKPSTSRALLLPFAAAAATCLPWMAWSFAHHRSFWGFDVCREWWHAFIAERRIELEFLGKHNWDVFVLGTWRSFWACFGYWSTWLSPLDYELITLVCGLGLGALAARWRGLEEGAWGILALFVGGGALTLASHVSNSFYLGFSPQGRYLAPLVLPLLLTVALGFASMTAARWWRLGWGPALVVGMAILHQRAWNAERGSNVVAQPTRAAKATLLAHVAELPGTGGYCAPTLAALGGAELTFEDGQYRIRSPRAGAGLVSPPIAADRLGWLTVEATFPSGATGQGEVRLLHASKIDPPNPAADSCPPIPIAVPTPGVIRWRIDLRKQARALGNQALRVAIVPPTGAETISIRRFDMIDRES